MKGRNTMKISAVYDNGGETADRYTVVFDTNTGSFDPRLRDCLGMSNAPTHPQGVSMWGSCQKGSHLGKRIGFKALPAHIQRHVHQRIRRPF